MLDRSWTMSYILLLVLAVRTATGASLLGDREPDELQRPVSSPLVQYARDCQEMQRVGSAEMYSGVYLIQPPPYEPFFVYCDFETDGGGWTVIQRRVDGSVNFQRSWSDYREGFGDPRTESWLGNEKLSTLTAQKKYQLRIELTGKSGAPCYAEYSSFRVGKENTDYQLFLGTYSGNAGQDSLDCHRDMKFTTFDVDNDLAEGTNCAVQQSGGWWFNKCDHSDLNGDWTIENDSGAIEWNGHPGGGFALRFTEMKIRPV